MSLAKKYDTIVIDTGGRDSKEMRQALLVSDIVLIPTILTSSFDQSSLAKMINMLTNEVLVLNQNLKALIVSNLASTNNQLGKKRDNSIELLKEVLSNINLPKNIKLANTILFEREIYRTSVSQGQSVIEIKGENKAKDEINSLYQEIFDLAKE